MFLWPIFQFCLCALIVLGVVTQIIFPALNGKPLFWFFRKSESKLLDAQRELSELDVAEKIKDVQGKIKDKVKDLRSKK